MQDHNRVLDSEIKQILTRLPQSYIDWGTKLIGADKAWEKYRGKGIKVGIIDTGIDYNHPDLRNNVKKCRSFIDNTDGYDEIGHGTHVAGIIAGSKNGSGIIGVAPECEIYSAKIFDKDGRVTNQAEIDAMAWMVAEGVHVVNMSYGGWIPIDLPQGRDYAEKYRQYFINLLNAGVLMSAASGNEGRPVGANDDTIMFPARFPETFATGAISQELQKADFSSAGPMLDFAMPGVDVYSCYPNNRWVRLSGTSMAAPYLTGCMALLQEYAIRTTGKPLNYEQMKKYLVAYSRDLGVEGIDPQFGHGKVNIGKIGTAILNKVVVELDQPMVIMSGRTLAPLRFVVEVNGGSIVSWNNTSKTVIFNTANGDGISMQVDNPNATVNGNIVKMDQPMTIANNRTVVPIRFIVELCGGNIASWDNNSKTVVFKTSAGKTVTMQADNPKVTIEQ